MMHTVKVVVFMEVRSLSDEFEQIMMTAEQMKKVLDLVQSFMPARGKSFVVPTSNKYKIKLTDIRDCYSEKEVERMATYNEPKDIH